MKILLVTNEDPGRPLGGLGTFIREMQAALRTLGHDARVLFVRYFSDANLSQEPSALVDWTVLGRQTFPVNDILAQILESAHSVLIQALPILQSWQPDIVHCNDRQTFLPFRGLPNALFSLHLCLPDLHGIADMDDGWFQEFKIDRFALTEAPVSFVYSRFMKDRVQKHIAKQAAPVVVPLGIYPPTKVKSKPTKTLTVSFFGRLNQNQKGLYDYISAVNSLDLTIIEQYSLKFRIHGQGAIPENFDLRRFEPVTHLSGLELSRIYSLTHIVVMPSLYEPFGLVGLEALAHGCVLLCTKGLGMDEYFRPPFHGEHLGKGPASIREALLRVLSNWQSYSGKEPERAASVSHYTWRNSAGAHVDVYQKVLQGRASLIRMINSTFAENQIQLVKNVKFSWTASKVQQLIDPFTVGQTLWMGKIFDHTDQATPKHLTFAGPDLYSAADSTWDTIVHCCSLEFSLDPFCFVSENSRVTKTKLIFWVAIGQMWPGQTLSAESESDWAEFFEARMPGKSRRVLISQELFSVFEVQL